MERRYIVPANVAHKTLWDAQSLAVGSNTSWEMEFRTDTEAGFLMLIFLLRFDYGRIGIMRRYVVMTVL